METDKNETPAFQLHGGAMQNRLRDVFGCLDDLEVKHKAFERSRASEDAATDSNLIHQGPCPEDMETINSEFKHPGALTGRDYHSSNRGSRHGHTRIGHNVEFKKPVPPSQSRGGQQAFRGRGRGRGRAMPDYKVNPEKWTEYSLEDVDVSDSANKKAAFSFLQERRDLQDAGMKSTAADVTTNACSKGQFLFKKPSKTKTETKQDKASGKHPLASVDMETDNDTEGEHGCMELEDVDIKAKTDFGVSEMDKETGVKRKLDESEERTGSSEAGFVDKSFAFKSRKTAKRQIRSRQFRDEDSD